jgi:hypothetical protein
VHGINFEKQRLQNPVNVCQNYFVSKGQTTQPSKTTSGQADSVVIVFLLFSYELGDDRFDTLIAGKK